MRARLSYANVMATVAVFIALGGTSYAISKLPKNSVGTKQLKKNAVATSKIKNEAITVDKIKKEAITGEKVKAGSLTGAQINASTLGTVPHADSAKTATVANSLPPAEPWHKVGTAGEPNLPLVGTMWDLIVTPPPSTRIGRGLST